LAAPRLGAAETARDWWLLETSKERSVRLVIHPAGASKPAMKYHLLPEFLDRLPGNAAVDYGKVTAEHMTLFGNHEWLQKNMHDRLGMPLEELRGMKIDWANVLDDIERGGRREYCDWQLPIRTESLYSILLPEVQQSREFARLVALRARVQVADGQYDEAVKTLQSGYALARNVARGPTLVQGLVGIAIAGMMDHCVFEMAQQPGAPNLYWALTSLPQPLIDLREAMEAEANSVYLMWPELREVETSTRGSEYWRETFEKFWKGFLEIMDNSGPSGLARRPEVAMTVCLKGYPIAKERLIAAGMPAERIEAMPVPQVVLLYTMRTYEQFRDESFKWFYVPYWQGCEGLKRVEREYKAARTEGREVVPIAQTLLPAIGAVHQAAARSERAIAVLRLIEALRIYGAAHEGRLPDTLNDLTEVPVPIDPFTGKPFEYRREGDRAIIEGPPMPGLLLKLEIQMAGK
jgi:hypothetical protein